MTDENQVENTEVESNEVETLKNRLDMMGIKYHHKAGVDKLRTLLNNALDPDGTEDTEEEKEEVSEKKVEQAKLVTPAKVYEKKRKIMNRRNAGRLVRVRVNCMNPNKKEWEGEIISVGSAKLGTFKKYVPFNIEEGYHIPYIIYQEMKERMCTINRSERDIKKNGGPAFKMIKEFAIEVLDPLTKEELKDLAQQQAMAGGVA